MIEPRSLNEQLLYSTLAVRTNTGSGSGFIYSHKIPNGLNIPMLITNKHVVYGANQVRLVFHLGEQGRPTGETHTVFAAEQNFRWIDHPSVGVDLCCIPLVPYFDAIKRQGKNPFYISLDESIFPSQQQLEDLTALENVVMVGYPNGLSDEVNNFPLLRRGSTASHPAVDFNGGPQGMVDMACFPGSSGSPIFLLNEGGYHSKDGSYHIGGTRFYLLGVLTSGPVMRRDGEIEIRTIPTQQVPVPVMELMIHLGYYVKTREVQALAEHVERMVGPPPPPQQP